jgi:hypothetical protein
MAFLIANSQAEREDNQKRMDAIRIEKAQKQAQIEQLTGKMELLWKDDFQEQRDFFNVW